MTNPNIRIKRSAVPGKRPSNSQIELGELALNTNDGRLFTKKENVGIGTTVTLLNVWTENVGGGAYYNDGSVGIGTSIPTSLLELYTSDGNIKLGDITAQPTTDVGISFSGLGTYTSAIFTELDGQILSYGINTPQIQNPRNTGRVGGIFRLDSRPPGGLGDSSCFVIKYAPVGFATTAGGPENGIKNGLILSLQDGKTYLVPDEGNVLVGLKTDTGTLNQKLQVLGGAYISGNIGVGTTNPTSKLQVDGNATINGNLNVAIGGTFPIISTLIGEASGYNASGIAVTQTRYGIGIGTTNPFIPFYSDSDTQITNTFTFYNTEWIAANSYNNSVTRIGADSGRSIEIGMGNTDLPKYIDFGGGNFPGLLYPDWQARILRNGTDDGSLQILSRGNGTVSISAGQTSGETGNFDIFTANTRRLRVSSTGNIGLNVLNPTSRLHVSGDSLITGVVTATAFNGNINAGIGTITNLNLTNLNVSGITTTSTLNVGVGGTIITTTSSGFVGVGTISPQDILDIRGGDLRLQSDIPEIKFRSSDGTTNQYYIGANISNTIDGGLVIGEGSGVVSGTLRILVGPTGNIGINTNNPTSRLHVSGDTLVTGVVTATTFIGALSGTATSTVNIPNLTGDVTSNNTVTTLATVNSNVGTFGGTGAIPVVTVNGKGLVTGVTTVAPNNGTLTLSVSGTGLSGSASFTANQAGNSTFTVTSNATSDNTNSTIVSRNGSGGFVAGVVTATQFSTGSGNVAIGTNIITGPAEITIDPAAVGDNTGAVRIKGDLYVDGTQTIINSSTIELADFNVGIATTVGTNLLLDGAGIGIGSTAIRKTITWNNSASALTSSEDWNLVSGKQYEINGTSVLSSTTLGSGVVNSSLTSVGTLNNLNVSGVSTISVNSSTDALRITQTGTGNALLVEDSANPDSTPFVVNLNGFVGIGTTNPGAPLNVLGVSWLNNSSGDTIVRAQGLTVGYTPNADYTPGVDPTDSLRNTSLISRGTTRPVILTFRNVDDGNAFWDFVADAKTDKFYIQRGGNFTPIITWDTFNNIGIGTTNPTSKLHVVGDVLVSGAITSTDYNSASDINLKENIKPISDPIDKVMNITGVSFNWKAGGKSSMGVIAQEIEKVMPEIVSGGDSKTVNYNGLIGLLIEVVKEQQKEINMLKENMKRL